MVDKIFDFFTEHVYFGMFILFVVIPIGFMLYANQVLDGGQVTQPVEVTAGFEADVEAVEVEFVSFKQDTIDAIFKMAIEVNPEITMVGVIAKFEQYSIEFRLIFDMRHKADKAWFNDVARFGYRVGSELAIGTFPAEIQALLQAGLEIRLIERFGE